jgi:hypothetical protein
MEYEIKYEDAAEHLELALLDERDARSLHESAKRRVEGWRKMVNKLKRDADGPTEDGR